MTTIAVIGLGFVGLTTATIFATKGFRVVGIDIDKEKINLIQRGNVPFYEPFLGRLVARGISSKRLIPTHNMKRAIEDADLIFVCVGTPMQKEGDVNLDFIKMVSDDIGKLIINRRNYPIICIKSTVPPGTTQKIVAKTIEAASGMIAGKDFGLVMTPEFLKEGTAVFDALHPHLVVVGSKDKKSRTIVTHFFEKVYGKKIRILTTNIITAEMIKYTNNSFLATKISFINTIANICNRLPGTDVDLISEAIGADPRIGPQFLKAGPGYGGSCFPKDVKGFIHFSQGLGYDPTLLQATDSVNKHQVQVVLGIMKDRLHSIKRKKIAILGTAFKKNTNDIRESVSIRLIRQLLQEQACITVHDPMALKDTKTLFSDSIKYSRTIKEAIRNADCIILMTDWDEYERIDQKLLSKCTPRCIVIDTRRILKMKSTGSYQYIAVGRSDEDAFE